MKMRMKKRKTRKKTTMRQMMKMMRYDDYSGTNVQKIRPWDVLMNITSENMQNIFNETVEKALGESPGTDIQKAEEIAYDELKQNFYQTLYPATSILLNSQLH